MIEILSQITNLSS